MQKLLGRQQSQATGAWIQKDGTTESGLIVETQDRVTLKRVWFCFGRGIMTQSSQNVSTNTDTAKTSEDDNLTFTAEGYKPWNNKAFATYYEEDDNFDISKMFADVFPGASYKPEGGKDASTSSSTSSGGTGQGGSTGTHQQ